MELITSRDNRQVKLLQSLLSQKKKRDETGLFALEGYRLCRDAAQAGLPLQALLLTQESADRYDVGELLRAASSVVWITSELADKLSHTKTTQGIFAVGKKLKHQPAPAEITVNGKLLLLAGLQDPGNLGTILRTAQALGVEAACLAGCPDLYSPKVLRAAMGAVWRMPIQVYPEAGEMVDLLRGAGVTVYAAALEEHADNLLQVSFAPPCGVLVGNEGSGLPSELVARCNGSVVIPMAGGADSLNAAVAASILLWELMKQ